MAKDAKKVKLKANDRIDVDDIIKEDNSILREISFDVPYPLMKEDKKLMHQLIDYVRSSIDDDEKAKRNLKSAYGLSAIQLGQRKKMLFVRVENEFGGLPEEFALINPRIIEKSDRYSYLEDGESCLSVEDIHKGLVNRHYMIKIVAIDYFTDREVEIEAKGLTAIVLQHEMDHLLGILFYDRINKLNPYYIKKGAIKI
ncbi:MAG: peptide deformylase [Candidatus Hepatoplasma vulgare]|nr:MAG: peptide deformylase [Candidatus Hepatoplasma sp.]